MEKSSTGLDVNVAAGLAVLAWWLTGLIFLLIEKSSSFVRFYAAQAILLSLLTVVMVILSIIIALTPGITPLRGVLIKVASLLPSILWLVSLIMAFQGKVFEIPVISKLARQIAGSVKPA